MPLTEFRDLIVVRVDGGICSQIYFVALGLYLQRRGYRVKYDLDWFRVCGKDLTGQQARNWDFPLAFPGLSVEEATAEEINVLRSYRARLGSNVDSFRPPLYIGGYSDRSLALLKERLYLRDNFRPEIPVEVEALRASIESQPACAVHVRRGDLADGNVYYGGATSLDYFRMTMEMVRGVVPNMRFYFFSDDPSWVRANIAPFLQGGGYTVVDANGSDRGYVDLFLISCCDYVISSVGTLGVMGAVLSAKCKGLFMSHVRDDISREYVNVIYVNDDMGRRAVPCENLVLSHVPESRLHGLWGMVFRHWARFGNRWFGVGISL